ncbi:esterase-like activity of phytase family protein [Consotaella aegiceratis]|uniref:esterase-like activity of phytase family protein n=1 Tax=Consotaella aegiceratis TaxID=3097961 RepID=UPI002F40DD75
MASARTLSAITLLLASTTLAAQAEPVFNRVASFPVAENIPADMDNKSPSSAEIVAASADGNTLIYSDSPLGGVGFIDITDPAAPKPAGYVKVDGEPTSVAVAGGKVLLSVNTSQSYTDPSGNLAVIDLASKTVDESCDLGGQPDSVAVSPDGAFVAIAIENERDEDLNDGEMPQMPAGTLQVISLTDGMPDCGTMKTVDMTGLAEIAPEDPEPEFVDFNDQNEIVVSLQENNHFAIVDAASGKVTANFSAGTVDLDGIDAKDDGKLEFTDSQDGRRREPDSVKWIDDDHFASANEGDYKGGSRSFTIFNKDGTVAFESGPAFEYELIRAGHYPDKRSDAKGVEPEGLAVGTFGDTTYLFVMSERGSAVGVYTMNGETPEFSQLLPSGIGPESGVTIPGRNLFATANEEDLVEDGAARSHVMIYELSESEAAYPQIVSDDQDGKPLGWGALSGLAADPDQAGMLYAVSDSFYSAQPTIFAIDATQKPAHITRAIRVTEGGEPAEKLDLEGVTTDGEGGFWLASEGNPEKDIPHQILHVDGDGAVTEAVPMPAELTEQSTRFGAEGVTRAGDLLWVAIQREWKDDPKGSVKLLAYDTKAENWAGAVRYPLDVAETGWVGLSEITANGDWVYIVERDNQIGAAAKEKKLYRVALSSLTPAPLDGELPTVEKEEVHDFVPDLKATGGYVVDKVEGFTIDADGTGWVVTDNDGVDDSSGETMFFSIGKM